MQATTDQKSGQEKDEIWFTEHHPVYTLGHAATEKISFQQTTFR